MSKVWIATGLTLALVTAGCGKSANKAAEREAAKQLEEAAKQLEKAGTEAQKQRRRAPKGGRWHGGAGQGPRRRGWRRQRRQGGRSAALP